MALHRLTLRVGLPFVLLVLVEAVALDLFLSAQIAGDERRRFEQNAAANAAFIEQASLPTSPRLADDLHRVTGYRVFFRRPEGLEPPPAPAVETGPLTTLPADGRAVRIGVFEAVAVPIEHKHDLVLLREVHDTVLDPRVLRVVAVFVALTLATAWVVVRGIVGPLRRLAGQLPEIEAPGPLAVPEAERNDEIGELARAFVRTRAALHEERETRQRVEKLAVLGRMTAALAHEVQNPVAAIRMHAQLLRGGRDDAAARIIEGEARRISSLLDQWLFLTRPEAPATRPVDVGALVREVADAHRIHAEHAAVQIELAIDGEPTVVGDEQRLGQVFRNLLVNALQAMPGGGTLRIDAAVAGDRVRVRFADTGRGFSPTALARFGEFFYSEKEGGMGIGLSVASEILKAHGGSLAGDNRPEGGATVTVLLPRADPPAQAP